MKEHVHLILTLIGHIEEWPGLKLYRLAQWYNLIETFKSQDLPKPISNTTTLTENFKTLSKIIFQDFPLVAFRCSLIWPGNGHFVFYSLNFEQ